ncbi:ABC transporter ATP-binding protein [Bacillus sp. ISL-55]|uniref:ABC transporter ATP-binding protein n=1 Tax=Bacillus sp. ISL-55 TaxID=2819134 RepID=UPI001BE9DB0B|nr:ABC transporter ATP-binding protein [Bacillus sp. ISL-55]MBT2693782.1 ABC transporter ATP-binding protein [Bacillus sp. ISL-55]
MILSVEEIQKSYGKEKVLHGVSIRIHQPEIVALVGPNGSGKSTLLGIVTNLISPDHGKVKILNRTNKDPEIFRYVSFMQDNSVLYDYLTGYDHLQFIGDVQGISKGQILSAAERVGMESYLHKKVCKYSLGMKQHLLLTMAIVNEPKLLILDEPLNGLDPTSAIRVRNLLLELNREGTAIILSSHNLSEIDRVTSHILFLKNGQLIEEDLSLHEKVAYELTVQQPEKVIGVLSAAGIEVEHGKENKLIVSLGDASLSQLFKQLSTHGVQVLNIEKKVIGSEERYQMIFGKKEEIL